MRVAEFRSSGWPLAIGSLSNLDGEAEDNLE